VDGRQQRRRRFGVRFDAVTGGFDGKDPEGKDREGEKGGDAGHSANARLCASCITGLPGVTRRVPYWAAGPIQFSFDTVFQRVAL
jgi:hypothetical protein